MNRNSGDAVWRSLLFNSFVVSGILIFNCDRAFSQVTPDNTLGDESSVVNSRDASSESIDGGAVRGQNLFHSFEEFNVGEDKGVYFANPDAVTDIFSRVTGNDVSNILGTLGVDGAANLYLINPNGIVFGEGASLDVQGSFSATTADGIEFGEQGFFSAVNPTNSVLTISVPLGLQFGSNPGSIINRSFVLDNTGDNIGLQVPAKENLTLIGGDVSFEAGEATASGGNIEIGGLKAAGTIGINNDGSLSFPEDVARADLFFSGKADLDVRGMRGGSVTLNGRNVTLEAGKFDSSSIRAGITADSSSTEAQAGDITINATDNLTIDDSTILNRVDLLREGDAGNIKITTGSLNLTNGGRISATTAGEGDAGGIEINATDSIIIDGESDNLDECVFCDNSDGSNSGVFSLVDSDASGNGGEIKVTASSLIFTNGGRIDATTSGQGNSGRIDITATDAIAIDGGDIVGYPSGIFSKVNSTARGNAKDINILAGNLSLSSEGQINASTSGQGDAGNINLNIQDNTEIFSGAIFSNVESGAAESAGNLEIKTNRLLVQGGGLVAASVLPDSSGRGGNLTVNASESIEIIGTTADGSSPSGLSTETQGSGIAGNLEIATGYLSVRDGGTVKADTADSGRGGNLTINASEVVEVLGGATNGQFSSSISADTSSSGDAGNITVTTQYLVTEAGGFVGGVARMGSTGNAGNLTINASDSIVLIGQTPGRNFPSAISASVLENASGNGGNVSIETQELRIKDGAGIFVSNLGRGQAGTLEINATDSIKMFGSSGGGDLNVSSGLEATGQGGNLTIQTGSLSILDGSQVLLATLGKANAGTLKIKASDSIEIMGMSLDTQLPSQILASSGIPISFLDDSLISLTPNFTGEGGNITLQTSSLVLRDGGQINASASGSGDAGSIFIDAEVLLAVDSDISTATLQSSGGTINITAGDVRLREDSDIRTEVASGTGGGGDIILSADSVIAFDDSDIFAFAADGRGGNITLDTLAFFAENFTLNSLTAEKTQLLENNNRADVNATGNQPGVVSVPDVSFIQNSLTDLPNNSINTDELVANSCVSPVGNRQQGKFIITGGQSLPVRPGDGIPSKYPTGEVRNVPENNHSSWQPGDPIVEPQGAYRLANGKLVLSRECSN
ncbi:MAG: hypothetical protein RLZZ04_2671 [Cyanobacteriota bacterium]|jgi:filamentous hemagglutinin family protein